MVKVAHLEFDPSQSVSQALDHRKICTNIKWESYKDSKDRNIVQYKCEISNTDSFFNSITPQLVWALQKSMKKELIPEKENYFKTMNTELQPLKDAQYNYSHKIELNLKEIESYSYDVEHSNYESDIEYAKNKIEEIKKDNNELQTKLDSANQEILSIENGKLVQQKELMDSAIAKHKHLIDQKSQELIDSYKGVKVYEIYRWTTNDNGIFLVYGGTETIRKNIEKPMIYSYSDLNKSLQISYSDNTDNYQIYRRTRQDLYLVNDL
jgi:hypothetical protein